MRKSARQGENKTRDLLERSGKGEGQKGRHPVPLNFDVQSYRFNDLDLEIASSRLPQRDQNILILHLMGHTQRDIARVCGDINRSVISRRLRAIMNDLEQQLR